MYYFKEIKTSIFVFLFSDLIIYDKYQRLDIRVCGGVEYLTFDILLHAKPEQKVVGNKFFTPIMFFIKKFTYYNLSWVHLDCNIYFLFKNKLLMDY